jgi:hypothetical protein
MKQNQPSKNKIRGEGLEGKLGEKKKNSKV